MKDFTTILIFCLLISSMYSCKKEIVSPHDYPRVNTNDVENINSEGVSVKARLLSLGKQNISDHGFIYGDRSNLEPDNSELISLGVIEQEGEFECRIENHLVPDDIYYTRAFVKGEDGLVVLGQTVSFISKGCKLFVTDSLSPITCIIGDTISIYGTGFSRMKDKNWVTINSRYNKVLPLNDSVCRFIVSYELTEGTYDISIKVWGRTSIIEDALTIGSL